MTIKSGTQYEGKARKELQEWNIFSVGLQPDASPDLILPQYHIGLEIKSTRMIKFYPSKNRDQFEYLKNQFPLDWPGYAAYYMIYFFKAHSWEVFPVSSQSPFKAGNGISLYLFISGVVLKPEIQGQRILIKPGRRAFLCHKGTQRGD